MPFEFREHTADVQMFVRADDLPRLFIDAASGLAVYLFGEEGLKTRFTAHEEVEVKSADLESLLVDWLGEILFLSEINRAVYAASNVQISGCSLFAHLNSCPAQALDAIKAVTYSDIFIKEVSGSWEALVTFDI